jgi:hypothetical protein
VVSADAADLPFEPDLLGFLVNGVPIQSISAGRP